MLYRPGTTWAPEDFAIFGGNIHRPPKPRAVRWRAILRLVVVAAGDDSQLVVVDRVDQSVGIIDSSGPEPCQIFFQRRWLADPLERRSLGITN